MCDLRTYLDSAPAIYAVERHASYFDYMEARLSVPADTLVVSPLTMLECRVKPIREDDQNTLMQFDLFFENTVDEIVPLTRDVIDTATLIRARYGFATPDAIHLGAAMASGCDVFLTNDNRLARFGEMSVEVIEGNL